MANQTSSQERLSRPLKPTFNVTETVRWHLKRVVFFTLHLRPHAKQRSHLQVPNRGMEKGCSHLGLS